MPALLQHIDQIARQKQRGVLFVQFDRDIFPEADYTHWQVRQDLISWLEQQHIPYTPCLGFANEWAMSGYRGELYFDVCYDEADPLYQALSSYLEDQAGQAKFEGVQFCYCPLETAMQNQHHDEPGFWEKWADEF